MKFALVCSASLLLFALSTPAQPRFCIGGDLDQLTATEVQACQQKSNALQRRAARQGVPADWQFVTVCDESGWKQLADSESGRTSDMAEADQSTDGKRRVTLVRGSHLELGNLHQVDALLAAVRSTALMQTTQARLAKPSRQAAVPAASVQQVTLRSR